MFEQAIAEASAFSLDRRNFDYLPDVQATSWRQAFLNARRSAIPAPRKLIVELLNACNLDCPICRVGQHGIDPSRRMPLPTFEALIRANKELQTVRLNGLGESTLLPDFEAYLLILQQRAISVELISNGSAESATYDAVLNADGHILISWDAASPTVFEKLRRPALWRPSVERLRKVASAAREKGRGRCSLIFTLQKGNVGEFRGVVALAEELGVSAVQMNVAKTPTTRWISDNIEAIYADVGDAASVGARSSIAVFTPSLIAGFPLQTGSRTPVAALDCSAPWDEVVIRWNGDVQPCNMFNPYVFGNIHRQTFREIWRNAFAEVFRQKLNTNDAHPYCRGCVYMPAAYAKCRTTLS